MGTTDEGTHMDETTNAGAAAIVVGYTPTPIGEATLRAAIEEARLRGAFLHVVNASRADSDRPAPSYAGRQAADGLDRPAGAPGVAVLRAGGQGAVAESSRSSSS